MNPPSRSPVRSLSTRFLPGRPSLRLRIGGWTVFVFALMVSVMTIVGVISERNQLIEAETIHGEALVEHLISMPAMQSDSVRARVELERLGHYVRSAGAELELQRGAAAGDSTLVSRPLTLSDGEFHLVYRLDPGRLRATMVRALGIHGVQGLIALAILVPGTEWILRRRLEDPVGVITHQIAHMRMSGGWDPKLPDVDHELEQLTRALSEFGPVLAHQVEQSIDVERRAAVAMTLIRLHSRVRQPLTRAMALVSELQARDLVQGSARSNVRDLARALDSLSKQLAPSDDLWTWCLDNGRASRGIGDRGREPGWEESSSEQSTRDSR